MTLKVSGPGGSDEEARKDFITVADAAPVVDFTATPTRGQAPLAVQFTDLTTHAVTAWAWDFGDGTTSTKQHPSHTYETGGAFSVTLTVSGPGGQSSQKKIDYISVNPPTLPDLTVTIISGTTLAVAGSNINVNHAVKNIGDLEAGPFTMGLYLSTDNLIDPSTDIIIGSAEVAGLAKDKTFKESTLVKLPDDLEAGTYYFGAVADTANLVKESNETNNTMASTRIIGIDSRKPDLVIARIKAPAEIVKGEEATVMVDVANRGLSDAGEFTIDLSLSKAGRPGSTAKLVAQARVPALARGQQERVVIKLTLANDVAIGKYHFIAVADSQNTVPEWGEDNNVLTSAEKVKVVKKPPVR